MGLTLGKALRLLSRCGQAIASAGRASSSIAFVGAGGKTTSLFSLAHELGRPTLVTTTTHLGAWQAELADIHVIAESPANLADIGQSGVTLVTGPAAPDARLSAIAPSVLRVLSEIARNRPCDLLIEADGARQKPLKAPSHDEPQIPSFVDAVVVVAGLHGLGTCLGEDTTHRAKVFAALSGLEFGQQVTPEALARVLVSARGGLKRIPSGVRRFVLLNQADSDDLQSLAYGMAGHLLEEYDAVVVADMGGTLVHAVHERCAGVVLAAGGATRFGSPKQLIMWRGQPLVRIAAQSALKAGLNPVIVVTGSYSNQVRRAVEDLPVQTVENPTWQEGQGSSVRAGVAALPTTSAAAVFLLADQPFITPAVIRALVEAHAREAACIFAPLIEGSQRGNPVLFDRDTFDRLRALEGDAGGRSIFPEFRIHYVPWHDDRIALDIDTQSDYQQLLGTDQ